MEDYLKVKFAKVLGTVASDQQPKPDDCPKWMADAYTRLCGFWSRLLGNRECNQRDYPLLTLFAETTNKLETRIAELESIVKSSAKPAETKVADFVPTEKLDQRTKEGRAQKAALVGA